MLSRLSRSLDQPAIAASLFLAPSLVCLGIFVILPLFYLVYLSFTQGHLTLAGVHWVGLKNYQRLLLSPDFWQVIGNTLYFAIGTVIPSVVIPLGLAVLLDRQFDGRSWLRSLYFLPSVISIVAAGLGWRWLFQPDGIVNQLLGLMPPPSWLGNPTLAMPVLILLSVWKQLGFNLVVFLAGLQTIPASRYEAAELDGADPWAKFWHITLPGLSSTTVLVLITTLIFTLRGFEQVFVVTGGGPLNSTNILVYYIYEQAFGQFDFGYGAAAAIVLMLLVLALVYWQLRTWQQSDR
ncbi:MAG: sugar ABC transporter permease [Pseudanabaenaceae cyanobacterium bins.68]|nr:sugar ABC transporter permease [Pseudanabaenaceae cyanobacterium bins.68]